MNCLSPGLEDELKTRLAQCYEAEKSLRSAAGQTDSPGLRAYLEDCAQLYKGLGELLSYSAAGEGSRIYFHPENHDDQRHSWMELEFASNAISDRVIHRKVSEGHAAAVIDMKATLNRNGLPENIAMVLFNGIRQIRDAQNRNDLLSDPD